MIRYRTVLAPGKTELVIEKSRFIGLAVRVQSREEADAFFTSTRAAYADATHVVPAFIVGEKGELKWASDDGEPQGTAGPPMLQVLEREGLTNIAVCVVRYFGGRLLGTGGLVRAYTDAAKGALEAAGRAAAEEAVCFTATFDYATYPKLQYREQQGGFQMADAQFADGVTATFQCAPEEEEKVRALLTEYTSGAATFGPSQSKLLLRAEKRK